MCATLARARSRRRALGAPTASGNRPCRTGRSDRPRALVDAAQAEGPTSFALGETVARAGVGRRSGWRVRFHRRVDVVLSDAERRPRGRQLSLAGRGTSGFEVQDPAGNVGLIQRDRGGDVAGVIFHSDKGGEYVGDLFAQACRQLHVTQSMGQVGSALDNAAAESWHSTLEHELLSLRRFTTKDQARREGARFIDTYNHRRRHITCEMLPPPPTKHCSPNEPRTQPTPARPHEHGLPARPHPGCRGADQVGELRFDQLLQGGGEDVGSDVDKVGSCQRVARQGRIGQTREWSSARVLGWLALPRIAR